MDSLFLQQIKKQVEEWRGKKYQGAEPETLNILTHIKRVGFLHAPQVEALETYIYLKEIIGNKPSLEVFRLSFASEKELLIGLGIPKSEAFELIGNDKEIERRLAEAFGTSDYANQVYALTMGSGKTILMAAMMLYDFTLSFYHPKDGQFAKNALVFAPDTTIIESLKEIKTFDYSKVLPKEYANIVLNIKYHYLESPESALAPIGNYNVIVSNSQKIILKTRNGNGNGNATKRLFGDTNEMERREVENARLQAIRQLSGLIVFVDEAHHSYGQTLEGTLKKTRQTIEYLHKNTPLTAVINLTGTPYVNNKMIADVVYHFGLKEGIERGILKQVHISDYGNVKSQQFVSEVVDTFLSEYGTKKLEGRLPKIAFYSASIEDLRKELKPKLEKELTQRGISFDKILEYHTEAEESKDEFLKLDTAESKKQFVLLVGKGTEGWNCRSLVACALYRKPHSSIFVLQSSTRCLRSIGDNSTKARIFLSLENYKILDRELKSNFSSSISELNAQDQNTVEHTLKVEKRRTVKVKKVLKEIVAVQNNKAGQIKVDFSKFKKENYQHYINEGGIFLGDGGRAGYAEVRATRKITETNDFTFYEIAEIINRRTHLSCFAIEQIVSDSGKNRTAFVKEVNECSALLPFTVDEILNKAYSYEEKTETVEEMLELTKLYPFKISVQQGKNKLVIYRENEERDGRKGRIGFHINPYNFDSGDEKDLFRYLRDVLERREAIKDVYFTGGVHDASHNDFYFEYWSPEKQRIARYFPDFLVETTKGRFLVVEVKSTGEKLDYEANKKSYGGTIKTLTNEVFAKEVGFKDFQAANKNFDYRIVFDASIQREQVKLFEEIEKAVQ
ncbi:MAG TPA: DEAD/DEAH box helicase family protein [Candidatus Paceibacterota bacterium]|nr:DEAD/DEAH box helicase family protein [Candidatus Pacearchaeota archaeon]HRZ51327.1 DEAD/DEAH box helicase family protein [Candidatus Paceibacterota bacterium]HSA37049.1 DEAD/DEAH box helicase family protein [Candidatus Paceibacterota bacterium]